MKKSVIPLISLVMLGGCNSNNLITTSNPTANPTSSTKTIPVPEHHVSNNEVYLNRNDGYGRFYQDTIRLSFIDGSEIPYLNFEEMCVLLDDVYELYGFDVSAEMSKENDKVIISLSDEQKCYFDIANQTLTFPTFDEFFQISDKYPLTICVEDHPTTNAYIKRDDHYTTFNIGHEVVYDFKNYEYINLYENLGNYYIPLQIFGDIFVTSVIPTLLLYNGEDVFLTHESFLSNTNSRMSTLYYGSEKLDNMSRGYAKYLLDELAFNLDYHYGLKEYKNIDNFHDYLAEINIDEMYEEQNYSSINEAWAKLVYYGFDDGHSTYSSSPSICDGISYDTIAQYYGPRLLNMYEKGYIYRSAKRNANIQTYQEFDNTAYINFNGFNMLDNPTWTSENITNSLPSDTIGIFAYAWKKVHENPNIENVVFDLSTNTGGAADALLYAIGATTGEYDENQRKYITHVNTLSHISGSTLDYAYSVDLNLDGRFNHLDRPFDADYNVSIITSVVSFSCGNIYPTISKRLNDDIQMVGLNTGGGTCVVSTKTNAIGTIGTISGNLTLGTILENGDFLNTEDGVAPDFELDPSTTYNRNQFTTYLNNVIFK